MIHARADYDAIQPFPTKRPHHVRVDGQLVMEDDLLLGVHMDPIIPDDEPVFLVRAQDIVGPDTVRAWADYALLRGADPALVGRVRAWANEMQRYAEEHGKKVPDTPEGILR